MKRSDTVNLTPSLPKAWLTAIHNRIANHKSKRINGLLPCWYLATVVDWFSRKVLAWRLSITLEADCCMEAVEEALARHGKPGISSTPIREHRSHQNQIKSGFCLTNLAAKAP